MSGLAEPQLGERAPDVIDALVADPAQNEVLLDGRARVAAGVLAHDRCEPAELLGSQVAARDLDLHRHEALLPLLGDVRAAEALELRGVSVR